MIATDDLNTEEQEQSAQAQEYKPGELAPVIVTTAKVWKPADFTDKTAVAMITDLVEGCSKTDEAARRYSVVDTWEARHIDRGHQYLIDDGKGGWKIAGTDSGNKKNNAIAAADDANLYPTNIFSAQGDIATGALNRGKIKVSFTPRKSKNPQDVEAADEANSYKYLWEKNNKSFQADIMNLGWTDCRVFTWTRSIASKQFGVKEDGSPRVVEVSTAHGVLESKLPMMSDKLSECGYAQVFEELDYAICRASYPWMGNKIKPSYGTAGELEFERIARINTRIGITGKSMVGTSGLRETTMGYTWFRPGMYFDDKVTPKQREFLLANFPEGLFVVMAGSEFCCCWTESMDDHGELGMFTRGFGQNRRSLGSSDIPIQKRINIWADLWDKFVRTSIPMTLLEDQAFNAEAIAQLEANPSRFVSVALGDGQTMDSVVGQTPAPQPIPGMSEMFQWYVGPLIQSIDGATPALFGGGEGSDNTVGATQIRLNQALERYGPPWIMVNNVVACAARQAAVCCGNNGDEEISDTVEGYGDVSVDPSKMKGNFACASETLGSIPESGAQREAKVLQILDMANANQQIASLIATPSNAREIVKALHIDDVITIDEANSEDKQLEEIEVMLDSQPLINPAWQELSDQVAQLDATHEQAKAMATQAVQGGDPLSLEIIQKGAAMEQQVGQLKQQLAQTPQYLPSVPVAQDDSEDHATEAATLFAWMQEPDGRSIRKAAGKEQPGGQNWNKWQNNFLHWQGHKQMMAKLAADKPQPIPLKATAALKVTPTPAQTAQLLTSMGMPATQEAPEDGMQPHEITQEREGVDANGVQTKQKISIVGKGLNA